MPVVDKMVDERIEACRELQRRSKKGDPWAKAFSLVLEGKKPDTRKFFRGLARMTDHTDERRINQRLRQMYDQCQEAQGDLGPRVLEMVQEFPKVQEKIDSLSARQDSLERGQRMLERGQEDISRRQTELKGELMSMKAVVHTQLANMTISINNLENTIKPALKATSIASNALLVLSLVGVVALVWGVSQLDVEQLARLILKLAS